MKKMKEKCFATKEWGLNETICNGYAKIICEGKHMDPIVKKKRNLDHKQIEERANQFKEEKQKKAFSNQ